MTDAPFAANWIGDSFEPDYEGDAARASDATTADVKPLPVLSMASLDGLEIPPREWIVKDWLPAHSVTLLAGGGATGKSLLTQQWLTAIGLGAACLSMPASEPLPTLYVNCEDESDEMARRNVDIAAALHAPVHALGLVMTISRAGELGNDLGTFDAERNFRPSAFFRQIELAITTYGIRVLALDNLAHMFTGNENIRGEVTQFVNSLTRLAMQMRGAVILLGHPAKAEGSEYSGSTGWENAVRSRLFLSRPEPTDGEEPDPNLRILTSGKVNYSAKGAKVEMSWHKGAFVVPAEVPKEDHDAADAAAGKHNALFLECLAEATKQRRAVSGSPYSRTYAPKVFAAMPTARRVKEREFKLAMERLLLMGKIALDQTLWPHPSNRNPVVGIARLG